MQHQKICKKIKLAILLISLSLRADAGNEIPVDKALYHLYQNNHIQSSASDAPSEFGKDGSHDLAILYEILVCKNRQQASGISDISLYSMIHSYAEKLRVKTLKEQILIDCARVFKKAGRNPKWALNFQEKADVITDWQSLTVAQIYNSYASSSKPIGEIEVKRDNFLQQNQSAALYQDRDFKSQQNFSEMNSMQRWLELGFSPSIKPYNFSKVDNREALENEAVKYFKDFYSRSVPNQIFHEFSDMFHNPLSAEMRKLMMDHLQNAKEVFASLKSYKDLFLNSEPDNTLLRSSLYKQALKEGEKLSLRGLAPFFSQELEACYHYTEAERRQELAKRESEKVFQQLFAFSLKKAKDEQNFHNIDASRNFLLEKSQRICGEISHYSKLWDDDLSVICVLYEKQKAEAVWSRLLDRLMALSCQKARLNQVDHPDFAKLLFWRLDELEKRYQHYFQESEDVLNRIGLEKPNHRFYSEWRRLSGFSNAQDPSSFSQKTIEKDSVANDLKRSASQAFAPSKQMTEGDEIDSYFEKSSPFTEKKRLSYSSIDNEDVVSRNNGKKRIIVQEQDFFQKSVAQIPSQTLEEDGEMDMKKEFQIREKMKAFFQGSVSHLDVLSIVPSSMKKHVEKDLDFLRKIADAMQTLPFLDRETKNEREKQIFGDLKQINFPEIKSFIEPMIIDALGFEMSEKPMNTFKTPQISTRNPYALISADRDPYAFISAEDPYAMLSDEVRSFLGNNEEIFDDSSKKSQQKHKPQGRDDIQQMEMELLFGEASERGQYGDLSKIKDLSIVYTEKQREGHMQKKLPPIERLIELAIQCAEKNEEIEDNPDSALLGDLSDEAMDAFFHDQEIMKPIIRVLTEIDDELNQLINILNHPSYKSGSTDLENLWGKCEAQEGQLKKLKLVQMQEALQVKIGKTYEALTHMIAQCSEIDVQNSRN